MTDQFTQADLAEAVRYIATEQARLVDLYVLEKGPLALERTPDGARFVVKQDVRMLLKSADELRAEGRNSVFRIFNSDPNEHSITNEQHVMLCAECHAIRHVYEQGQRDERARIRAGVEALTAPHNGNGLWARDVLAVIDAAPQGGE